MIDFRFHLVSIVSIFLALAVGIVLGAGPLQGSIGTQLTDQVSQLRQEKDTLRSQLDDANKTVTAQDQYASLVAPAALAGQLKDQSVVLFVSPDVAGKFSQDVQQAVAQSGAKVTTVVTLKDDYRDPATATARAAAAQKAAGTLALSTTGDGDSVLALVLATVLMRSAVDEDTPATYGAQALGTLKQAGLIDFTQSALDRADLAVMITGPIAGTAASVGAQTASLMSLATALDAQSAGVVVAASQPSTAVGQEVTSSLVTAIRKNATAARGISTVDHADTVMGAGVIVLSLVGQRLGTTGHFGISPDAQSAVPQAR